MTDEPTPQGTPPHPDQAPDQPDQTPQQAESSPGPTQGYRPPQWSRPPGAPQGYPSQQWGPPPGYAQGYQPQQWSPPPGYAQGYQPQQWGPPPEYAQGYQPQQWGPPPGSQGRSGTPRPVQNPFAPLAKAFEDSPLGAKWALYRKSFGDYVTGLPSRGDSAPPPVVTRRPFTPMSLSTYRGLSLAAAWLIGFPGILMFIMVVVESLSPSMFSSGSSLLEILAALILASAVFAPMVFRADLRRSSSMRVMSTIYYGVLALCAMGFGASLTALMSIAPAELRGMLAGMNLLVLLLVVLLAMIAVTPFFPDSHAFFRRIALFERTVRRIRAGELSVEQARREALPPISVPSAPLSPPPSMNRFFAILVALLVFNLAQHAFLPALLNSMSDSATDRLGIEVDFSPILPLVFTSLFVIALWGFVGKRAHAGSHSARVFLTVLLVGNILFSIWLIFDPTAMTFGVGLGSLVDVPAWFWALTVLSSVVSLIAAGSMLFLLYRPLSNRYFVGTHYYANGSRSDDDDLPVGGGAPGTGVPDAGVGPRE